MIAENHRRSFGQTLERARQATRRAPVARARAGCGRVAVALLAWVVLAGAAAAQEEVEQSELLATGFFQDFAELDLEALLDTSEVTSTLASRRDDGIDGAPGVITVLTREEITRLGVLTLEELLRTLPGFDVQRDALGRVRISSRGLPAGDFATSSESVLILFNGVRLNEPLGSGATAVNLDIPADDIERLEVLRGPGAALFGDGALAGVVAITTRIGDLDGIEASAGVGSFGSQRHYVRVGSVVGDFQISGFVYFSDTDGAKLRVPRDRQSTIDELLAPDEVEPVSRAPGLADTDRREVETSYKIAFRDYRLNFRFRREVGGNFVGFNQTLGAQGALDNKQWLVHFSWRGEVGAGSLATRAGYTHSERFAVQTAAPPGFTLPGEVQIVFPDGIVYQGDQSVRRFGAEAVYDQALGSEHHVLGGVSLHREESFGLDAQGNYDFISQQPLGEFGPLEGVFAERGRGVVGAWVQDTWSRDPLSVTAGLRLDRYGDVGAQLSPRLGVVWELRSATTLKLLYGRSFRAPTLTELYFHVPGLSGDPELRPTTMDTIEVAAVTRLGELRLAGDVFLGYVRDPIRAADPTASPFDPQPIVNGTGYDTRGFELEGLYYFGLENSAFGNYSYRRAQETDGGSSVAGIPSHLLNLGATIAAGPRLLVTPSLTVRSQLPRAEGDPREPVAGRALLNLTLQLRELFRSLTVTAGFRNLFDEEYFDPSPVNGVPEDYPRPGRSIFIHATYTF